MAKFKILAFYDATDIDEVLVKLGNSKLCFDLINLVFWLDFIIKISLLLLLLFDFPFTCNFVNPVEAPVLFYVALHNLRLFFS